MTDREMRFEGLQVTDQGLWVHFRNEVGTTVRHAEVLVPWSEVTSDEVLRQIDRTVRRALVEAWSGQAIEPLF